MGNMEHDELWPVWAIGCTDGELELGAQLPTRDGRRCGNARIIEITKGRGLLAGKDIYVVLTDAGTRLHLTEAEVRELFHAPEWVSAVGQAI